MRALIVDDEIMVVKAIQLLVPWDEFGFDEISTTLSSQDAAVILSEKHPELMVTDMVMQGLNGMDLMDYCMKHSSSTKIIVVSGYDNFDYVRCSMLHGSIDYLLKPIDKKKLIDAVQRAAKAIKKEEQNSLSNKLSDCNDSSDDVYLGRDIAKETAEYLDENYQKAISLNDLACSFYVSQEYLCRKFRSTYHTTMLKYLNDIRISHAKILLENMPEMRVADIAYNVGFSDAKYFSRQFKKSTGLSPYEYRQKHGI